VEQASARGWELRPESARLTEVVKERIGEAREGLEWGKGMAGEIDWVKEAGQLVKATRSVKASMGSKAGLGLEMSKAWFAVAVTTEGAGSGHLVAWMGNMDGS
jgi:hypothetical protein